MARTTTTTSAGTSRNRARIAASRGNTRYTNITAASRITLAASNPNAVTSTGTIQVTLIRNPPSLCSVASSVGTNRVPYLWHVSGSDVREHRCPQIVADRGASRNQNMPSRSIAHDGRRGTRLGTTDVKEDRGAALLRSRLDRYNAVDNLLAVLLLIAEPNLLPRGQSLELPLVCGPHLKISLLHDDPVPRPIHHSDLPDHLCRRRDEAASSGPGKSRVAPRSDQQK